MNNFQFSRSHFQSWKIFRSLTFFSAFKFKIKNLKIVLLRPTTYHLQSQKSFTLIEILIATSIFTAVIVLAVGGFTDSINFNSSSSEQRVVRESSRNFMDYLTQQLRQVGSNRITINSDDYLVIPATGGLPQQATIDYTGTGYFLFDGYTGSGVMTSPDLSTGGNATAMIFPLPKADAQGNTWYYVGLNPDASGCPTSSSCTYGIWRAKPLDNGSGSPDLTRIGRKSDMGWTSVGQFLPTDVFISFLKFSGINPQGTIFDATTGAVTSYSVPAQPYVTTTLQLAPASDSKSVVTFQSTITSRDYNFAFPQCSIYNDPTKPCQ